MAAPICISSVLTWRLVFAKASILVYALADLRGLWRMGKLSEGDQKLLELPLSPSDVMVAAHHNMAALKDNFGENGVEFYMSSFASIQESLRKQEIDPETGEASLGDSQLVTFDDENADTEMVYGIAVNSSRKRITVGFRGSVTVTDFITDANSVIVDRASPIEGARGTIGVHHGFHDYLYGTKKGGTNKCQKIMEELVALAFKYPDYKIYTCGHSLGGALCTLFALEAAADPRLPKPISCVSIASPKVGSASFRRAFQSLEKARQLRCLRIANYKDLVTLLPDRGSLSCLYIVCCQSNVYRHVGMELKLYSASKFTISKSCESNSYFKMFLRDWRRQVKNSFFMVLSLPFLCCCREDFLKNHGCGEYMERILGNWNALECRNLNELYWNPASLLTSDD